MHPAHLLTIKQRVLTSEVAMTRPLVARMLKSDDPDKLSALLEKLNG